MKTEIVARHPEIDETLRRYVLRRVRSAINRLSTQIRNITVKLDRHSAQQADQRNCVIEIRIDGQEAPLIVDSAGPHWLSAIDKAVESAARAVRRQLKHTLHQVTPLQLLKGQHAS
ncbi:HPF/RaiA family ribosome-associated protein [Limnobacter sp.]|uniref:HPF/RaiA family ribosome-associated protein n=1 Tax=Limnobacter sp. TaxID=2003368 RepID=UPI0027B90AC6|nr:HPF/RaiA family ribosome-associated protein [Limnobacter sp.]